MSDARKIESIKFAQESAKQIITLSTALITFILGLLFVSGGKMSLFYSMMIVVILLMLLGSIISGLLVLFSLSGILISDDFDEREHPLNSRHYMTFGKAQFFAFALAVSMMASFSIAWSLRG